MKVPQKRHISFAGCGFIGIYHVGVSACLQQFSPHLLRQKIGGSSAGAMCALALVSGDISLEEMTRNVLILALQASNRILGPFNPNFNLHQMLVRYFEENLSENVAERVSGRLFVSLTKARNKKNVLVSEFSSKRDLIDAVCSSSFIPVISGWRPPTFRGQAAFDGGYSDNIPTLGEFTLTVSPFAGDASICPCDSLSSQQTSLRVSHGTGGSVDISVENFSKLSKAIIPPDTSGMEALCCRGWNDAKKYLISENMIRCKECSGSQVSISVSEEECTKCTTLRNQAKTNTLPQELLKVFEEIRELESQRSANRIQAYIVSLSSCLCTLTFTLTRAIKFKGLRPTIESCPFVNF